MGIAHPKIKFVYLLTNVAKLSRSSTLSKPLQILLLGTKAAFSNTETFRDRSFPQLPSPLPRFLFARRRSVCANIAASRSAWNKSTVRDVRTNEPEGFC